MRQIPHLVLQSIEAQILPRKPSSPCQLEVHQVPIERWDMSMYFGEDYKGQRRPVAVWSQLANSQTLQVEIGEVDSFCMSGCLVLFSCSKSSFRST